MSIPASNTTEPRALPPQDTPGPDQGKVSNDHQPNPAPAPGRVDGGPTILPNRI